MKLPLQITFRNMRSGPAIERAVREKAEALDRYCEDIVSCRVVVEAPHRRHRTGRHYRVLVDVTVPGHEIIAGRSPAKNDAHEDVYVAVRDAFQAARRELQGYVSRRRGAVKTRGGPPHAWITDLFPERGYGFLEATDGRRLFFHANSVTGDLRDLEVGQEVRFAQAPDGDKGPQASTVDPVGRSGHTVPRRQIPASQH